MRPISEQRRRVEAEGQRHSVTRGWRGRWHFENMEMLGRVFDGMLRMTGTRRWGMRCAQRIRLEKVTLAHPQLPQAFDGWRVLLLTDLHIDGMPSLVEILAGCIGDLGYDLCVLGGDYTFGVNVDRAEAERLMARVVRYLRSAGAPVVGVLGNHDRYRMARFLETLGVRILVNEHTWVRRDADQLVLTGLDDSHYYQTDDVLLADRGIPAGCFKVMLAHSPERYRRAAAKGYHLYLAGHTHGGQVCLPGGFALVTCATIPRRLTRGCWRVRQMVGYTSRGVGTSSVPVRFFCPPEVTLLTLRRGDSC